MFGDKRYENVGYPTPEDTPTETTCLIVPVPANAAWWALYIGLLYDLTLEEHWQVFEGGQSAAQAAADAQDILFNSLDIAMTNQCAAEVPAPYWDTAADVGTQAPVTAQDWYGIFVGEETWQEQIEDWVIAGFVAYAAGLGSAIAFLTIAPRFRLAFRTHDLGAIVRVFIDAAQAAEIDTYSASPGIIYADIFADKMTPDAENWYLVVEQASESQLQVVRKELDPGEVYPTNQRYNGDDDVIQTTTDGGTTWVDTPQSDPRHSTFYLLPPVTGTDPRCIAASNMVRYIKDFIDDTLSTLSVATDATALLTLFVTLLLELGPFAILIDLILGLAILLFGAGIDLIAAAFTSETYDTLVCIFYCHISNDGTVTAAQLDVIEAQIVTDIGGLASDVLTTMLFLMGEIGLSNAGIVALDPSPDCSSCECTFVYSFNFQEADWGSLGWHIYSVYGHYTPSQGYQSTQGQGLILQCDIPGGAITFLEIHWNGTTYSGSGPAARGTYWRNGSTNTISDVQSNLTNPYTCASIHTQSIDNLWLNPSHGVTADSYILACTVVVDGEISAWADHRV